MNDVLKTVKSLIEQGDYKKADEVLAIYKGTEKIYDDTTAIFDGSLAEVFCDRERLWNAICKGLKFNCRNYELYVMLGNYYLEINLQQAYLCFENALLYCNVPEDREQILGILCQLEDEYQVYVPKSAIVVLSYNLLNFTKLCIESIRSSTLPSSREIIVVDNASTDGSVEWLCEQKDIKLILNTENKGFPRACNQGIGIAEEDSDIFLLNNDTILTANSLFWLRMGLYENEKVGTTGSVSNYVSNGQQIEREWKDVPDTLVFSDQNNIPTKHSYEEKLYLVGFALLIKRSVLNEVGVLDERFSPGNSEDIDYGLRVLKAGYQNILCKNSFILHFGSKSFGKLGLGYTEILKKNHRLLNEKWGMQLDNFLYPQMEVVNLIQEERANVINVLEIGCGCGANLAKIKSLYPLAKVYGIENNPMAVELAKNIGDVTCGDVGHIEHSYSEEYFDYCIVSRSFGDEVDMNNIMISLKKCVKDGRIFWMNK